MNPLCFKNQESLLDTVSTVRGSGWVCSPLGSERVYDVPIRYRGRY
jgi:hypothetical protein